jgi:hypothetical protein
MLKFCLVSAPLCYQPYGDQYSYKTGNTPISAAVSDVNHDTYLDIIVANQQDSTIAVLLGNGQGQFQPQSTYAARSYPISVISTDFNNDNKPDLVAANYGDNTVSLMIGNGDGTCGIRRFRQ